jgi:hypothetical protein
MYIIYERCEPLLKKYIALIIVPLIFTGCGTSLENLSYTNSNDTTTQTDLENYSVNTDINYSEQNTDTILDTNITDGLESYGDDTTSDDTTTTDVSYNDNTIVLEEVTTATEESTEATTTHILSSYGDEEQLITLATSLYNVACEMYWNYYYSSPYPIDYDQSIEDSNGLTFFLIDDSSITSLEDIRNDWFDVFSTTTNPQDFDGHFIERDGRVYVNGGDRGGNIYYSNTEFTGIVSTVGDEVTFSTVSHYIDPNDGSFVEDITSEFSIILEDNSYHVGKFTLPY